jgi:hypothetical protein
MHVGKSVGGRKDEERGNEEQEDGGWKLKG